MSANQLMAMRTREMASQNLAEQAAMERVQLTRIQLRPKATNTQYSYRQLELLVSLSLIYRIGITQLDILMKMSQRLK